MIVHLAIAMVWLLNGLVCKVLNLVPRHQQIVAVIFGEKYSRLLIVLIGFSEIIMAIWILTNFKARENAIIQIVVVISMNVIEYIFVPHLLLWGRVNIIFAILFSGLVYYNEFVLQRQPNQ
jgi:hypothetical protein